MKDEVGDVTRDRIDRLLTVSGGPHDGDFGIALRERDESFARFLFVIAHEGADRGNCPLEDAFHHTVVYAPRDLNATSLRRTVQGRSEAVDPCSHRRVLHPASDRSLERSTATSAEG